MNQFPIGILGTGSALPDQVSMNADLATRVDTDPEWIQTEGIAMQTLEPHAASTLLDAVARQLIAGCVDSAMDQLFFGLHQLREGWSPAKWRHFATMVAREHPLCKLLHEEPFTRRAFEKPRGYPGDAALLDDLYYGTDDAFVLPATTSSLGRRMFKYIISHPTGRAVRARRDLLARTADAIASTVRNPRILAVAAGHLREAQLSQAFRDGAIGEWVALDQDAESLKIASQSDGCGAVIQTVTASIQDLLRNRVTLGAFDLIYAAGLYDYLVQPVARKLTRHLFDMLRPGGRLLIGNVVPGMLDAAYMEAYMDWWLVYRSARDMQDLAALIPPCSIDASRIFEEEQQSITYLELIKADGARSATRRWQHPSTGYSPHPMQP